MSERHAIKIYQIPWLISSINCLILTCLAAKNNESTLHIRLQLFIATTMFQWWLKLLRSRKQAAEQRQTHPLRPPPKPDPRKIIKKRKELTKEFNSRCQIVGYPLAILALLGTSNQWLPLWLPLSCIFIIDWFKLIALEVGNALDTVANQPSWDSMSINFFGDEAIVKSVKNGDMMESASLLLLFDALNTAETLLLASLNLKVNILEQCIIFLCNCATEHIPQCTWLSILASGNLSITLISRFGRYLLILWCRSPKFKEIFNWSVHLPALIRIFIFMDLPRLLLDLARTDLRDHQDLSADIDDILEKPETWTWQDLLRTSSTSNDLDDII